jgi:hypothetical protein
MYAFGLEGFSIKPKELMVLWRLDSLSLWMSLQEVQGQTGRKVE